ncbi:MAG: DUF4331 family protein [Microcoleus sp. PH2017_03_ELD_O_A]|jgi:hypothetical protein|uniref:DUF4331 family protein n=1 Tax=Microcoleus sp. PH2017_28_MFU_U_A TaxID=2798838 RepID=UPI001D74DB61|nr:DUF4331 family protein [Microcoleus sp. PH2017_28_MFU_U_A]MCC3441718.1 DUF4331 family protein [Microcoleus sp. PH2017_03_ELD_O_A]MCC3594354.1 DUF4331 family protein [Microcoleus sp. PH2017_28_MFU_U_A]
MSHHFDSPESRQDSRINICDIYLFNADDPQKIVAVMTISPLAGLPSPFTGQPQWDTFRPETAYEFRFDTDGDAKSDVVFRFVFQGDANPQSWSLTYLSGEAARDHHATGQELGQGTVNEVAPIANLGRIWTGLAGDPFFLDAVAARVCLDNAIQNNVWDAESFSTGASTTGATNVLAIVAELPLDRISNTPFSFYATVAANDHGHWTQVNRCGKPNFAATFNDNPEGSLLYNSTDPDTDYDNFAQPVINLVTQICHVAQSTDRPANYGQMVANWSFPDVLPFNPLLPASFGFAGINGRRLQDDFGTVVYTLFFNTLLQNKVPPPIDLRTEFPYIAPARPLPTDSSVGVPSRQEG